MKPIEGVWDDGYYMLADNNIPTPLLECFDPMHQSQLALLTTFSDIVRCLSMDRITKSKLSYKNAIDLNLEIRTRKARVISG